MSSTAAIASAGLLSAMLSMITHGVFERFPRLRAALEEVDPAGDDGRAIDRALGLGLRIKDLKRLGEALTERADIAARILAEPPVAPARWSRGTSTPPLHAISRPISHRLDRH